MFRPSNAIKLAVSAAVAAGTVAALSQVNGGDDLRNQAASLLRSGAQGTRWIADRLDRLADTIEKQDSEEYVNQQWAKIDRAQATL